MSALSAPAFAQDRDFDSIADEDEQGVGADGMPVDVDTDGDGQNDADDLDSDNDGILDADEAGDADRSTPPIDSDADGVPNFRDDDSDDDGVPDQAESIRDLDGDEQPDYADPDSDGDGFNDGVDVCPELELRDQSDLDGDGEGDACDDDLDGDAIVNDEDNCLLVANADQADRDGDGLGDACEIIDENGDGFDDRLVARGGCSTTSSSAPMAMLLFLGFVLFRRRAALVVMLAVGALSTGAVSTARAQEPDTFSTERLRYAIDRNGIAGVESGAVPAHLDVQGLVYFAYADDSLVARGVLDDGANERALVENRFSGGVGIALPLFDRFALALQMPFVLSQDRPSDGQGFRTPLDGLDAGLGDLRIVPKVQILDAARFGIDLAFMPAIRIPLGGARDYLREDDLVFEPEIAVSGQAGKFRMAANLAYRLRGEEQGLNLQVDDEVVARVGMALRFSEGGGVPLEIGASILLAFDADNPFGSANQTSTEVQGIVTWDAHPYFSLFGLAGVGASDGWGTPDWRASIGIRAGVLQGEPDPCAGQEEDVDGFEDDDGCPDLDNDEDGIEDDDDGCPMEAEDTDGFEDEDVCPDADNDDDGIVDEADACVSEPETDNGFEDDDGCPDEVPDVDGDGLNAADDACPEEAEDMDGVADEDGCPEIDGDGDEIVDTADRCPTEAGPAANGGCPDTDQDGDGVVDRLDTCPTEVGTAENGGCAEATDVRIDEGRLRILEKIYFRSGSSVIQSRSFEILRTIAAVLTSHPEVMHVRVEGHTDDRGREESNLRLSQARADAVVAFLVEAGIDGGRLRAVGYGESRPVAEGRTT
ncbi:MAG: OmpA family protein, partial [Myxococcota bacterium]